MDPHNKARVCNIHYTALQNTYTTYTIYLFVKRRTVGIGNEGYLLLSCYVHAFGHPYGHLRIIIVTILIFSGVFLYRYL
jgi:hypothetical protein